MKPCRATLIAMAVTVILAGCATTDSELSQKERDKMARDMEKANRQQAQAQAKMMRETGQKRLSR